MVMIWRSSRARSRAAAYVCRLASSASFCFSRIWILCSGMQTEQSCCGAFTVAVGIIGLMTAKEGQTDVDNMEGYRMIAELTDFMLGFYGTLHCVELQKMEIVGDENPCHAIVEALAKKLEELLAGRRIFRPVNGGQLGC